MDPGVILVTSGIVLTVVGMATSGLKLDLEVIKTVVTVDNLTSSQVFRLFPLGLGVVLVLAGTVLLVLPPTDGPGGGGSETEPPTAVVVVPGGGSSVATYGGPSTQGYVVDEMVVANTSVEVVCTTYAQPLRFGDVEVNLWNYTDRGWLNDHFVSTGVVGPIANGCAGTVAEPRVGKSRPTRATGPYAVITDEGAALDVRTEPQVSAPVTASLGAGTFVRLSCTVTAGPTIAAPRALGPGSSNNVWDRVVEPAGWVPDSYVATYSLAPVAPACAGV